MRHRRPQCRYHDFIINIINPVKYLRRWPRNLYQAIYVFPYRHEIYLSWGRDNEKRPTGAASTSEQSN